MNWPPPEAFWQQRFADLPADGDICERHLSLQRRAAAPVFSMPTATLTSIIAKVGAR
jgi:hypothetical protein